MNVLSQTEIVALMDKKDYRAAMDLCLQNLAQQPDCFASLSNAATSALLLNEYDKAIDFALKILPIKQDLINAYDVLSHAYGCKLDWWRSSRYGAESLRLRDMEIVSKYAQLPELAKEHVRQPEKRHLQIISFSLYGNDSSYVETAVLNAELAPQIYPDWVCRFYVDETVSPIAITRLLQAGAQVVHIPDNIRHWAKTMWRFLPLTEDDVARVIFRDADSVISQREAKAVRDWVASGKMFHLLRDGGSHTELILAGLWGAVGGAIPDFHNRINHYLNNVPVHPRFADQYFLREHVWLFARQSVCTHDRIFGFAGSLDFPADTFSNFEITHVGKDEGDYPVIINMDKPDGTEIDWTLRSRVSPLWNEDYSLNVLPEMRKICTYRAVLRDGKAVAHIPQRYHQGMGELGHTVVDVHLVGEDYAPDEFTVNIDKPDGTTYTCVVRSQLPPVPDERGYYQFAPEREVLRFHATVQNGKFSHRLPESQYFGLNNQGLTEISLYDN